MLNSVESQNVRIWIVGGISGVSCYLFIYLFSFSFVHLFFFKLISIRFSTTCCSCRKLNGNQFFVTTKVTNKQTHLECTQQLGMYTTNSLGIIKFSSSQMISSWKFKAHLSVVFVTVLFLANQHQETKIFVNFCLWRPSWTETIATCSGLFALSYAIKLFPYP